MQSRSSSRLVYNISYPWTSCGANFHREYRNKSIMWHKFQCAADAFLSWALLPSLYRPWTHSSVWSEGFSFHFLVSFIRLQSAKFVLFLLRQNSRLFVRYRTNFTLSSISSLEKYCLLDRQSRLRQLWSRLLNVAWYFQFQKVPLQKSTGNFAGETISDDTSTIGVKFRF